MLVLKQTTDNTQAAAPTLDTLRELFKPHLSMNKARLACFVMLVLAVIKQRTVSLVWLAQTADSDAKVDSIYRRFQRFFALSKLPPRMIGTLILALLPRPEEGWTLAMDRTNWQFGRTDINILVVTVIFNGMGFPIAWRLLPKSTKRGNSRKFHRTALMDEVLKILPVEHIRVLTMDREFVGKNWLMWLEFLEIRYVVRVKKNARIGSHSAAWLSDRNRWKKWAGERHLVFGRQVHFAAKRIKKGRDSHVAVISFGFSGEEALELYRQRWGIETLFSHLKKRGYQFEETHLTKKERVEKLFGVLAVAFALCYRWGQKLEKTGPKTKLKKHGYRAKSIFRRGFENLHRILLTPVKLARELAEFFDLVLRQPLSNFVV